MSDLALVRELEGAGTSPGPRGAAVAGLAVAIPERVIPNAPIAERLGVDEDWILARTGVRERHVAAEDERLPGYAARAARGALRRGGVAAADVDLVLVATMSHEQLTPSAAALVAAEIGAERAGAIDVNAACTGFVSALDIASAQIESGRAAIALVIGVDLLSRLTDPDDRSTAALFGDGAGAVVVGAVQGPSRSARPGWAPTAPAATSSRPTARRATSG